MTEYEPESGDTVLVRVRENGDSGNLRGKFVADVQGVMESRLGGDTVVLQLPFGDAMNKIRLKEYQAEFEPIDGYDAVTF